MFMKENLFNNSEKNQTKQETSQMQDNKLNTNNTNEKVNIQEELQNVEYGKNMTENMKENNNNINLQKNAQNLTAENNQNNVEVVSSVPADNNQQSFENIGTKLNKKDRASIIILVFGIVSLVICAFLLGVYGSNLIHHLTATNEEQAGAALGAVIAFIYFGFPSLFFAIISSALNITAFALSKQKRILKLVFMILSIVAVILSIAGLVLIQME